MGNKPTVAKMRITPDSPNAVRRELRGNLKEIEKAFGNTMTGYVLIAWPQDSDDCLVCYNKGYLPIEHLAEYAGKKLIGAMLETIEDAD